MIAVDLFAGAGGSTVGAETAGAQVVLAANHWPAAVETHQVNHPKAEHWLQDLQQADFTRLPKHDILLASPSCVGHTRARGAERPGHDAARSTAWAVVSAAEAARPDLVVVENVPEFLDWTLYPAWAQALQALGYALEQNVVDAADFGVPQHRRRLFLVASRSRRAPTFRMAKRPHRRVADVIRWDEGTWRPWMNCARARQGLQPLCARTTARITAGRAEHGERFLVAYYGSENGGRSIERPIGTLTTRDRYAVISGDRMRWLSVAEMLALMGFPAGYQMPSDRRLATHLLGNAVCPPVMTSIIQGIARG